MLEYYLVIRGVHVHAVMLSALLFLLRAIGTDRGGLWPRHLGIRILSWTIDSILLTAALMLATMLPAGVFANGWLWWKLSFVVAYVVAGSVALNPARPVGRRRVGLAIATLFFTTAASIAHTHSPRGLLQLLFG